MATLTNSSQEGVEAQLELAGLSSLFERRLSVQSMRRFKLDPGVYAWAAKELSAPADACVMVAAHGWDIAGAKWAGLRTAFVARQGQQMFPLANPPDLDVADFSALAHALRH